MHAQHHMLRKADPVLVLFVLLGETVLRRRLVQALADAVEDESVKAERNECREKHLHILSANAHVVRMRTYNQVCQAMARKVSVWILNSKTEDAHNALNLVPLCNPAPLAGNAV